MTITPRSAFVQVLDVMVRALQALGASGEPLDLDDLKALICALPGAIPGVEDAAGLMASARAALQVTDGFADARHVWSALHVSADLEDDLFQDLYAAGLAADEEAQPVFREIVSHVFKDSSVAFVDVVALHAALVVTELERSSVDAEVVALGALLEARLVLAAASIGR
jgi:hypothetical protein